MEGTLKLILTTEEIESAELLNRLAFHICDYRSEVLDSFRNELALRNYGDSHIRAWRKRFLQTDSVSCRCKSCDEELILDEHDLIEGSFSCPLCNHSQQIWYQNLKPAVVEKNLLEQLRSMDDFTQESVLSDELSNEQLTALLGDEDTKTEDDTRARISCRLVLRGGSDNRTGTNSPVDDADSELLDSKHVSPDKVQAEVKSIHNPPKWEFLPDPEVEKMSGKQILEILALRRIEYSPQGIQKMESGLLEHGYKLSDVAAWRNGETLSNESTVRGFKSASIRSQLLLGVFGGIILIDVLMAMQIEPGINIFNKLLPGSALATGSSEFSRSAILSLSILKIGMLIVSLPIFLSWLYRCLLNSELLGAPHSETKWALFWGATFIPMFSYYFYYLKCRKVLLASATEHYQTSSRNTDEKEGSFSVFWEAVLLFANPSVPVLWIVAIFYFIYEEIEVMSTLAESTIADWIVPFTVDVVISLATICFVWVVTVGQMSKWRSVCRRADLANTTTGLPPTRE